MADDIEHELREAASCAYVDGGQLMYCMTQTELLRAADTIARLRADLREALAVLQELVNYDNGGSGDGGAILDAAEKTLASHKENTDG